MLLQGTYNLVCDVKAVYHQEFDAALEDYNERQKRSDRKITDYFEHVANKEQDMVVEIGCIGTNTNVKNAYESHL